MPALRTSSNTQVNNGQTKEKFEDTVVEINSKIQTKERELQNLNAKCCRHEMSTFDIYM